MKTKKSIQFISKDLDERLGARVETFVKVYIIKNRKRLIMEYISEHFSKFMGEDRLLTSDEVMNMLQISRQTLGRRVKTGVLNPVNPEAKRNYRFMKSEVINYIERKGVHHV